MPAIILKYISTWLLSAFAKELAGEIVIITLRRWAKETTNTLDDEIVEAIAKKLNI